MGGRVMAIWRRGKLEIPVPPDFPSEIPKVFVAWWSASHEKVLVRTLIRIAAPGGCVVAMDAQTLKDRPYIYLGWGLSGDEHLLLYHMVGRPIEDGERILVHVETLPFEKLSDLCLRIYELYQKEKIERTYLELRSWSPQEIRLLLSRLGLP